MAGLGEGYMSLSLPMAHDNGQTISKAPNPITNSPGILDAQLPPQPSFTKRDRGFPVRKSIT